MICPRCGNEWDASKSPCTRCGLVIRMPGKSGPLNRTSTPLPKSPSGPYQAASGPSNPYQTTSSSSSNPYQNGANPSQGGSASQSGSQTPIRQQGRASYAARGPVPTTNVPPTPSSRPSVPVTPRPTNFSSAMPKPAAAPSMPETARPPISSPARSAFENPEAGRSAGRSAASMPPMPSPRNSSSPATAEPFSARGVPPRPSTPPSMRSGPATLGAFAPTETMPPERSRPQPPLRASRLVTDPLASDALQTQQARQPQQAPASESRRPASASTGAGVTGDMRPLAPGTLLRGGRYRLQEQVERQDWLSGVYEAVWIAQDAGRGGSQVMI